MKSFGLFFTAAVLIVGTGVLHGVQHDRWGQSEKLQKAAEKLSQIPTKIGNWSSVANEIPEDQLKLAEAVGSFTRSYVNEDDGRSVSVMILCGRPGPISVHPPTVCFTGAGWRVKKREQRTALPELTDDSFWRANFYRQDASGISAIQTFWGWSSNGDWEALDNPRIQTAGNSFLYKMYITTQIPGTGDPEPAKEAVDFMELFLPEVDRALFST